ncbi:MAG: glutamate N-acetyltransferase/amino-acid N-acetyltransferase [Oleiphilaceae bacterium]|jgi:glutamate N-acetyltransferase/amino-acid N-acetyltransferase
MAVGSDVLPEFPAIGGISLGVTEAGIKTLGRKDLVLIELQAGSTCAGVFTQNAFCAAPVTLSKRHLAASFLNAPKAGLGNSYLLINTGNANAGTGKQGMADAVASCQTVAQLFSVDVNQVLPFSTGVIGEKLPIQKIQKGIPSAANDLNENHWLKAAEGILTTDTRPKGSVASVQYAGKTILINGISKGAGMIKPNMATMLAFVGTDANIPQPLISELVSELSEVSFNRITVDGDTSTNDSCMLFASGASRATEIDVTHEDYPKFKIALKNVFIELAQAIIRDAEGATKFVPVIVEQAGSTQEALDVAYTIAHSPLIKTALFASDPNWGRILAALGRAPIDALDLSKVEIFLGDVRIVNAGEKCADYTEMLGQAVMDGEEIIIQIKLGRGEFSETVWTSDLSQDYVKINAEYRT